MLFLKQCSVLAVLVVLGATMTPVFASWAADFDGDSDVDLTDFAGFTACFNGPNRAPGVFCAVDADLDGDVDVDLADFAIFAACFNGPNRPPACLPQYTLTVEIPGGNGTCVPMSGTYAANTVVDLFAQPDDGCQIKSWSGTDNDSLTTNDNTVTMTGHKTVTLEFEIESGAPSGMVLIPAGEFQMGDHLDGLSNAPVHAVYVDAFYMDKTEVINAHYAAALNWTNGQGQLYISGGSVYKAGSGTSYPYCYTTSGSSDSRITWDGSTFGVTAGKENHPMVYVSWYGSVAYANWRSAMQGRPLCYDLSTWSCNYAAGGYRLPTEAEWEKAARGGASGHRFPWSDSDFIQHARANYYSYWPSGAPYYPYDTSPTQGYHPLWGVSPYPYTSPVGFFDGSLRYKADFNWPGSATSYQTANGANDYGLYDMAGNVWEWCNDWYSSSYYQWCVDNCATPCPNPRGPAEPAQTYRVLRGGGWDGGASLCRVAHRYYYHPSSRINFSGFRVVCSVGGVD